MDKKFELTIGNEIAEIDRVNQQFEDFARQQQVPNQVVVAMQIVFEELLSNVIKYNYRDDTRHEIDIEVEVFPQQIKATIVDGGIAFNPFDAPEPDITLALEEREIGGLGVHIVRTMMDHYSYERAGNKNVVKIAKEF